MLNGEKVRELLPETVQNLFDDIVTQRVLGASKHIDMIGEMFAAVALDEKNDGNVIIDKILHIADFFKRTRGEASQAVSNAINLMNNGLLEMKGKPREEITKFVAEQRKQYIEDAKNDLDKIILYGTSMVQEMKTIMVFDYSSTVNRFLASIKGSIEVYIPESRSIDGGHAFVSTCIKAGHKVHFIPDAAMLYALKNCQAVFIGAETFYPDGTVFNTTGSDMLAILCKQFNIPYYVLTPMMKVDTRAVYGYVRPAVENNLENRLANHWDNDEKEKVDFLCPELLGVEPQYVTAYITELGIIPANQMFSISTDYAKKLIGE